MSPRDKRTAGEDTSRSDAELLSAYRQGDEAAATALFRRYYDRLVEMAHRELGWRLKSVEESSDVAQSVFRSVMLRGRDRKIEAPEGGDLWPLLVKVMVNKIRNRAKFWKRKRRDVGRGVPIVDGCDPLERGAAPDDVAVLRDLWEQLLKSFSGRRRDILERLARDEAVKDIAAALKTTPRTVYNTRIAAAEILRKFLADAEPPSTEDTHPTEDTGQ